MALKPLHDQESAFVVGRPTAPMWARGLAFLIDVILLGSVWYLLWTYAQGVVMALAGFAVPIQLVLALLYFAIFDGPSGLPTPGKMAMSLRTVDAATLDPLPFGAALVRSALKTGPFIVMILGAWLTARADRELVTFGAAQVVYQFGLGCLLANLAHIIISPRGQGFHDVLAASVSGRDPVGEAMSEFLASDDLAVADKQMRPGKTALMILLVITAMASCSIGRLRATLDDPEFSAILDFDRESRAMAVLEGAVPELYRAPYERGLTDDGVTTLGMRLQFIYHRPVDGDVLAPLAVEKAHGLFAHWDDHIDQFVDAYFTQRSAEGVTRITDAQFQKIRVEIVERSSIFYSHRLDKTVAEEVLVVRYPPDEMIVPMARDAKGRLQSPAATASAASATAASDSDATGTLAVAPPASSDAATSLPAATPDP